MTNIISPERIKVDDFKRPITSPPTIFTIALIAGIGLGFFHTAPVLPLLIQILSGICIIAAGVWLVWRSYAEIERADTSYDPYAASNHLVTTGIYRYSRNPGYLGVAIIQLGYAVLLDNYWIVVTCIAAIWATTALVILPEEDKLQRTFGADYKTYFKSSKRWI